MERALTVNDIFQLHMWEQVVNAACQAVHRQPCTAMRQVRCCQFSSLLACLAAMLAASLSFQALQDLVVQLTDAQRSSESSRNSSWYVLQRLGPASFVVGQDPGGDKFKVNLGKQPSCTCR